MNSVVVTVDDIRKLKFCASGTRTFFKSYNLDYNDFVINGIDAVELLSKTNGDLLAVQAVEVANERQ